MKKKVFLIHGWSGDPNTSWFSWLSKELGKRDFIVKSPRMPLQIFPKEQDWTTQISKAIGEPDANTFIVAHSLGTLATFKYLQSLPANQKIGGLILISGIGPFINRLGKYLLQDFLKTPVDFNSLKNHAMKIVTIHGKNDICVPLQNSRFLAKKLGAQIIVMPSGGHFSCWTGVRSFPPALKVLLGLAS